VTKYPTQTTQKEEDWLMVSESSDHGHMVLLSVGHGEAEHSVHMMVTRKQRKRSKGRGQGTALQGMPSDPLPPARAHPYFLKYTTS
jgi:hypothetical protein